MRKLLIPLIAGLSVVAIAAPASAQYAPRGDRYNRYQPAFDGRGLQARVDRVREQIRRLEARRVLSFREGRSLEIEASNVQRQIFRDSHNGIQPGEAQRLEERIRRLEYRVQREATDMNNRPGYRRY